MLSLLEALHQLRRNGPTDSTDGLCQNLDNLIDPRKSRACSLLRYAFASWSEYSGNVAYPVPCAGYEKPSQAYWAPSVDKWSGEYGAARMRLLDYCIDYLEADKDNV